MGTTRKSFLSKGKIPAYLFLFYFAIFVCFGCSGNDPTGSGTGSSSVTPEIPEFEYSATAVSPNQLVLLDVTSDHTFDQNILGTFGGDSVTLVAVPGGFGFMVPDFADGTYSLVFTAANTVVSQSFEVAAIQFVGDPEVFVGNQVQLMLSDVGPLIDSLKTDTTTYNTAQWEAFAAKYQSTLDSAMALIDQLTADETQRLAEMMVASGFDTLVTKFGGKVASEERDPEAKMKARMELLDKNLPTLMIAVAFGVAALDPALATKPERVVFGAVSVAFLIKVAIKHLWLEIDLLTTFSTIDDLSEWFHKYTEEEPLKALPTMVLQENVAQYFNIEANYRSLVKSDFDAPTAGMLQVAQGFLTVRDIWSDVSTYFEDLDDPPAPADLNKYQAPGYLRSVVNPGFLDYAIAGDTSLITVVLLPWGDGYRIVANTADPEVNEFDVNFTYRFDDIASSSFTLPVKIENQPNRGPKLTPIRDHSVDEGQLLVFGVSAVDPDGDSITLSARSPFLTYAFVDSGNGSGSFSAEPSYYDSGSYHVTFVASDGDTSLNDSATITVFVRNVEPVIDSIYLLPEGVIVAPPTELYSPPGWETVYLYALDAEGVNITYLVDLSAAQWTVQDPSLAMFLDFTSEAYGRSVGVYPRVMAETTTVTVNHPETGFTGSFKVAGSDREFPFNGEWSWNASNKYFILEQISSNVVTAANLDDFFWNDNHDNEDYQLTVTGHKTLRLTNRTAFDVQYDLPWIEAELTVNWNKMQVVEVAHRVSGPVDTLFWDLNLQHPPD
ncbi:hypothetical protein KQH82_08790 [bacterium]|nr:hypothetical protein [bacterium]